MPRSVAEAGNVEQPNLFICMSNYMGNRLKPFENIWNQSKTESIKVHCRYHCRYGSSCFHCWSHGRFNWWHRTVPWKKRGDTWKNMAYPGHDDAIFFAIVWHLFYDLWLSDWRSTCLGFRYASVLVSTTSCNHTQKSCRSGKQQQNLFKTICQTVSEPFKPFEVKTNQGPLPIRQPLLPLLESLEMQLVASHRSLEEAGRLLWEWRSSCFGPRYALVFASTSFMIFNTQKFCRSYSACSFSSWIFFQPRRFWIESTWYSPRTRFLAVRDSWNQGHAISCISNMMRNYSP